LLLDFGYYIKEDGYTWVGDLFASFLTV